MFLYSQQPHPVQIAFLQLHCQNLVRYHFEQQNDLLRLLAK
ncbi:hypothetical protein STRINF_00796 [Streptococcus infantarius subsp. infantarius ATCC BAA-102]|uniref:Uncharacterized protein n=1 Tax=Streptococcus infantarius subsp. infantarius ATCC BAA-102 TaxID=471872 RepID=A0ABP2DIC9_9STRE|nr:hypothetical protein STRINF_00796 [Streptococcus infantarius subsp. infantarius ATCC BAA-102]